MKPVFVCLPGFEGTPVRGLTDTKVDGDYLRLCKPSYDFHFRIFDMSAAEDLAKYERLMTAAGSSDWVQVWKEEWLADKTHTPVTLKIAVKWSERYLEPPERGQFVSDGDPLGDQTP